MSTLSLSWPKQPHFTPHKFKPIGNVRDLITTLDENHNLPAPHTLGDTHIHTHPIQLQLPRSELRRVGVARASISTLCARGQTGHAERNRRAICGRARKRQQERGSTRSRVRVACRPPRYSGTKTKRSKITDGSREGGGRALFAARLAAILRGRPTLFRAATQPPEPPSIPKYPGWLAPRSSRRTLVHGHDESVNQCRQFLASLLDSLLSKCSDRYTLLVPIVSPTWRRSVQLAGINETAQRWRWTCGPWVILAWRKTEFDTCWYLVFEGRELHGTLCDDFDTRESIRWTTLQISSISLISSGSFAKVGNLSFGTSVVHGYMEYQ